MPCGGDWQVLAVLIARHEHHFVECAHGTFDMA
jgi:hypothetical protein